MTWVNGFLSLWKSHCLGGRFGLSALDTGQTVWAGPLAFAGQLVLLYDFHRKKKWLLGLSLVLALLFFTTKHPLENEVTVVDIGQGTASFAGYARADGSD